MRGKVCTLSLSLQHRIEMFCSSLREHPEWAPVVFSFSSFEHNKIKLKGKDSTRWYLSLPNSFLEGNLGTHHFAFPFSRSFAGTNASTQLIEERLLRLLFLSGFDLEPSMKNKTLARIRRLKSLTGSKDVVGIIFLLEQAESGDGQQLVDSSSGLYAYMDLQAL